MSEKPFNAQEILPEMPARRLDDSTLDPEARQRYVDNAAKFSSGKEIFSWETLGEGGIGIDLAEANSAIFGKIRDRIPEDQQGRFDELMEGKSLFSPVGEELAEMVAGVIGEEAYDEYSKVRQEFIQQYIYFRRMLNDLKKMFPDKPETE